MEKYEKTGYEEDALNSILEEAKNYLENRVQFKKYYSDLLERKKKELTDKQVWLWNSNGTKNTYTGVRPH